MEYSKEFKTALSNFSSIEKDRLIFRLLKKDPLLSKKLYFELIDPETVDEKRNQMENLIEEKVAVLSKYINNAQYFLMNIRRLSSSITEHVKVTTDKYGEVSLTLHMVNQILEFNDKLNQQRFDNIYKLYIYLINKIVKCLTLTKKLDEDYYIEINDLLQSILDKMEENPYFIKLWMNNGLDLNWMKCENVPDHFDLIIKDIKSQGFLK